MRILHSSHDITIRSANPDDLNAVLGLVETVLVDHGLFARRKRNCQSLLENAFVAEIGSPIVGFAALDVYSKKLAEIKSLANVKNFEETS
jgi:N-acetylglutamate synthase-like GNAT family acetyltransferase